MKIIVKGIEKARQDYLSAVATAIESGLQREAEASMRLALQDLPYLSFVYHMTQTPLERDDERSN